MYEAETARTALPVTAEDLALGMLLRDRTCFSEPGPPRTELDAAAGLQMRGHEFGHDSDVWTRAAVVARQIRLRRTLGRRETADHSIRAIALLEHGGTDEVREALDLLSDEVVLRAVTGELVSHTDTFVRFGLATVAAADRPARAAVAHWLAAVAAERQGMVLEADAHLRTATRAAPEWRPARRRLAEYEADRGSVSAPARPLDLAARLLGLAEAHVRRDQEFTSATLAEMANLPGCEESLALDVLLWEGGWFRRFLTDRDPLLPADEAGAAAGWVDIERTVFDVLGSAAGMTALRDVGSGERVAVGGVEYPVGARLCGRAVPVDAGHRLVGEVVAVPRGRDAQLRRVLQRRDGRDLLAWVAAACGPENQLVDGDPRVHSQVVLRTKADPSRALDAHYVGLQPGWWTWLSEDGDVLGSIVVDGNEITASTSSEAHMDRLLDDLAVVLPSFVIVREERRPVRPWYPPVR